MLVWYPNEKGGQKHASIAHDSWTKNLVHNYRRKKPWNQILWLGSMITTLTVYDPVLNLIWYAKTM